MAEITIGRTLSAATDSVSVEQGAGSLPWLVSCPLVPVVYSRLELGYTGDDVTTVTYYDGATLVATLTLAYNAGKLISVTRS